MWRNGPFPRAIRAVLHAETHRMASRKWQSCSGTRLFCQFRPVPFVSERPFSQSGAWPGLARAGHQVSSQVAACFGQVATAVVKPWRAATRRCWQQDGQRSRWQGTSRQGVTQCKCLFRPDGRFGLDVSTAGTLGGMRLPNWQFRAVCGLPSHAVARFSL